MTNVVSKSWCFTLNNYTSADIVDIKEWPVSYGVIGEEHAPTTGTPHLQGYVIFMKAQRMTGVRKLNPRASWRSSKGTEVENYVYNRKEKEYFILGSIKDAVNSTSTTLTEAIETIRTHGITTLISTAPEIYVRHVGGLEKYAARLQLPRQEKPTVIWLHGPTGSGKTRYVYDKHSIEDIYSAPTDLKFWDGYENQPVLLFDDFRRDLCKFHVLLKILDRYPYLVNVKNSYRQLNSPHIYITSPYSPTETYSTREDVKQLTRRISQIIFLDNINENVHKERLDQTSSSDEEEDNEDHFSL